MKKCPQCNTLNPDNATKCSSCGASLVDTPVLPTPSGASGTPSLPQKPSLPQPKGVAHTQGPALPANPAMPVRHAGTTPQVSGAVVPSMPAIPQSPSLPLAANAPAQSAQQQQNITVAPQSMVNQQTVAPATPVQPVSQTQTPSTKEETSSKKEVKTKSKKKASLFASKKDKKASRAKGKANATSDAALASGAVPAAPSAAPSPISSAPTAAPSAIPSAPVVPNAAPPMGGTDIASIIAASIKNGNAPGLPAGGSVIVKKSFFGWFFDSLARPATTLPAYASYAYASTFITAIMMTFAFFIPLWVGLTSYTTFLGNIVFFSSQYGLLNIFGTVSSPILGLAFSCMLVFNILFIYLLVVSIKIAYAIFGVRVRFAVLHVELGQKLMPFLLVYFVLSIVAVPISFVTIPWGIEAMWIIASIAFFVMACIVPLSIAPITNTSKKFDYTWVKLFAILIFVILWAILIAIVLTCFNAGASSIIKKALDSISAIYNSSPYAVGLILHFGTL